MMLTSLGMIIGSCEMICGGRGDDLQKMEDDLDMMEDDLDRMEDDLVRMKDSQNSSNPLYKGSLN